MSSPSVEDMEMDSSELMRFLLEPSEHWQGNGLITQLDHENDVVIHACHMRRNQPSRWQSHKANEELLKLCQANTNTFNTADPHTQRDLVESIIDGWEIFGGRFVKLTPHYGSDVYALADVAHKINKVTTIMEREYVKLKDTDIVCEQSPTRAVQDREANKEYQALVSMKREKYQDRSNNGTDIKQRIARRIIDEVHNNGGRFVRNDKFGLYKLNDNAILDKVQGSLRLKPRRNGSPSTSPHSTSSAEPELANERPSDLALNP